MYLKNMQTIIYYFQIPTLIVKIYVIKYLLNTYYAKDIIQGLVIISHYK